MSFGEMLNAFGSLGDTVREGLARQEQRATLSRLGEQLQGGDYAGAAKTAFANGDVSTGMNLLKMQQANAQQASNATALNGLIGGLYGGLPAPGAAADAGPSAPRLPTFTDASGAGGDYISNLFKRESGGNTNAKAPTSSAQGLGQFTTGTWNAVARQHPELGLTPNGRTDPDQMLKATRAFTADNEAILNRAGLPVTDATRYSLHFLGAGGGPKFVAGALSNPDAPAINFVQPAQASANRTIFFNRDGSPKTAGQVMGSFERSFGGSGRTQVAQAPVSVPTFGGAPAEATDPRAPMQMPGVIANPPLPPQRPVQIASADPDSMTLPAPAPAAAPQMTMPQLVAPVRPMTLPAGASGLNPAAPQPMPGPEQTASIPAAASVAPALSPQAGQAAQAQAPDDGADAPATAPAVAPAVPPQVRAQVSAQAPQHLADAGLPRQVSAPVAATPPASQARIQALLRASMLPGLSEGQSKVVSTLLSNELEQTKMPESVKQYIFAKSPAGGGFDGTFADFQNKKGDEGAKISAQLQARRAYAVEQGMDPQDPGVQSWIMSGKTVGGRVLKPGDILTGASGKELARNASTGSSMNEQTADFLAERVLAGDTKALIGLGRGAQGAENLAKIQSLAAQKAIERGMDPSDILRNVAEAQGQSAQARTLGTQAGRMSAAATEAEGAIALARQASAAVPRGSFVPMNRLSQAVQSNTGDPSLKAFNAANNTLVNTFARAISPSGVGTVADKEHAREMLSTADSPQAYEAVLQQMQAEIDMAHKAPQRARDILERERQDAKRGGTAAPAAPAASPGTTMVPNPVKPDAPKPAVQYREGQTATGPGGQKVIFSRGQWVPLQAQPTTTTSPQAGGSL